MNIEIFPRFNSNPTMGILIVILIPPMRITRAFQVLYFSSICLSLVLQHVNSVSFNLNLSDSNTVEEYIRFEGNAHFGDFQYNNLDRISLTKDAQGSNINNSSGRATYKQPVVLWDDATEETTNFTTEFSFIIQNITANDGIGDGLTFFLSPYPSQLPPDELGAQSCLGLFDCRGNEYSAANHIVAVEFDTYLNPGFDPNSTDRTDCHIGIDVNMIKSTASKLIHRSLFVGVRMTARIEFNSWMKLLSVRLWHDVNPNTSFSLNATVDLRNLLPNECAVGFSASTGGGVELNQIFSWSFNSTLNSTSTNKQRQHQPIIWLICVISITAIIAIVAIVILMRYGRRWYKIIKKKKTTEMSGYRSIDDAFGNERGPKRFPYEELCAATDNFAEDKKLGQGGFGSVYEGYLNGDRVAVKKVSKDSKQGEKEYISEVKIISKLRHRYLVPLVGWCHDQGEFLLVYQLMQNGSLDKHLYSADSLLEWPLRQKIVLQLGEALLYLHKGWEQCVLHRDIKPSNIMLDCSFNARLGDFGLARLIDHNLDLQTTNPGVGTRGYMATECHLGTENVSIHSDIFSFGVVLLEITCGRMPIIPREKDEKVSLVEWVWDLYGQNTLLDAVDSRLNGDFEIEEVERFLIVGLWCAHPERYSRPSIDQVMSVLRFNVGLPSLPPKMPMPRYYTEMGPYSIPLSGTTSSDPVLLSGTVSSDAVPLSGTISSDISL